MCQTLVYAIGGIDSSNIDAVRDAGAKGACVMSGFMQCEDVEAYLSVLPRIFDENRK